MAIGYRYGNVGLYTGGDPREASIAWKVLDYEYDVLGNSHVLTDVAAFLGVPPSSWAEVLALFRARHGDTPGIWLTRTKKDATELYGDYGDLETHEYDRSGVISDLGPDGIYVLRQSSVRKHVPSRIKRKQKRSTGRAKPPTSMGGIR